VRDRLREDLAAAMKARDRVAITVLRTTLAAIDNAEAVDVSPREPAGAASPHIAGSSAGVGSSDVTRRVLSDADIGEIIREEANERRDAASEYEKLGRVDMADALRREAAVLDGYLPDGSHVIDSSR
jgi:uncharacterized protein YqeY